MGDFLEKGVTFQSGSQLTHTDLNNLVDNASIKNNAIGYAQLADGSIAESIFGYPIISDEDINDQDYYLIWSATHSGFRKVKKSTFANSLNSLVNEWFETFYQSKEGTVLPTLTEPIQDTLQFDGNEFNVKAKYEASSGRINISGRLQSAQGVILLNTWTIESEYAANKFTIEPDQDNAGGTAQVDIVAELNARTQLTLEASNGNGWAVKADNTMNELIIGAHTDNSGGEPVVKIENNLKVSGKSTLGDVVVDKISNADGSSIGGVQSFFSLNGASINFGSSENAYVYEQESGSLYLNSGSLGAANWDLTGSVLTITTEP